MSAQKLLCWNCRGAGGREFAYKLKSIVREYRPTVVILVEPRISGDFADAVCRSLGKNTRVRSEATGFLGGLWALWDDEDVYLELEYHDKEFLDMLVKPEDRSCWALIAVYAHPNLSIRKFLWGKLNKIEIRRSWALISDFNCVLLDEERSSTFRSGGKGGWID